MAARGWAIGTLAVCVGLIGAFFGESVAHAQGEDVGHVDLGISFVVPDDPTAHNSHDVSFIVVNNGSRTAYDVEVVVDVESPAQSHMGLPGEAPTVPLGSATLDGTSVRWTIPALGGLQRARVNTTVTHRTHVAPIFNNVGHPHELYGKVTTASYDSNLSNNTARVWTYEYDQIQEYTRQVLGNYSVDVTVDNANPAPGGTVNFTITAGRTNPYSSVTDFYNVPPPIDLKVDIELTDGLTVTGAPTYAPATDRADSVSYSNGVFTIGTLEQGKSRENSVTLPIMVASSAVVNKQCLTATLTGNPPPGVGPRDDDISDNVAKVCLGEPPDQTVVFTSGQTELLKLHPCVGNTTYPCTDAGGVVLAVNGGTAGAHVEGYDNAVFEPENIIVQIKDPAGRNVSGTNLRWRTGFDIGMHLPGTDTGYSNLTFAIQSSSDSDSTLSNNPGSIWFYIPGPTLWLSTDPSENKLSNSHAGIGSTTSFDSYFELDKLGTYRADITLGATNSSTAYASGATYTFHSGPIAELEVRDGGSRPEVAVGQSALTILAANNGPDEALGARVTGLPTGAEVLHISQGVYNGSTGVWNIGEMKISDHYSSRGESDPTLVLSSTTGGTADVTITHSTDYTVCINSDGDTLAHTNHTECKSDSATTNVWYASVCVNSADGEVNTTHTTETACNGAADHTWTASVCASSAGSVQAGRTEKECDGWFQGTVYDYNADNNTAKITAAKGTGGSGPGIPTSVTALWSGGGVIWDDVELLYGLPISHYQVQRQDGSKWTILDGEPRDTMYVDSAASGRPDYRVRAVNLAGVAGPWSLSAVKVGAGDAARPLNLTAVAGGAGEIVLSWEPSLDASARITYYQVQWSRSGSSGWSNACRSDSASDLSCTQTGIPSGETRYYRVAAYAGGLGAWSDLAVATTVSGLPEAPRLSAGDATRGSGDSIFRAIRLAWNEPRENGSAIYAYEIEYVDYDADARACGDDWEYLDRVGSQRSGTPSRAYLDDNNGNGLWPGVTRCYRVSATNSVGAGAWSNVVQASTGAVPPGYVYPWGEADGQNAITLHWDAPDPDGGAPVTGYQLQYSDGTTDSIGELTWHNLTSTGASVRTYTHTGRNVGETWRYRIRARNSAGWGEWSLPTSVTIRAGAAADIAQPTLTVRATTSTEISLSWTRLCDSNREGDCENKNVDGYYVEYSEDGGPYGWERLGWHWNGQTGLVDSNLEPGTTLYYRVAGYDTVNGRRVFGRRSQVKSATTADFRVAAPQNFTITAEGERGLKLVWDEVAEGRDAASITGYRIERNTIGDDGTDFDTTWVARQTNRKSNTYVETGLTPNTDYYYRVAAVTRNGSVPYIGPYSVMERFFIPPPGG